MTTDAVVGGEGGRADVEQERWSLNDQRDFLLRSIDDAERELLAGDLSKDDYDVLLLRDQTRLAEVEAALAALGPVPQEATIGPVSDRETSGTEPEKEASAPPRRRRLSPWRRVGVAVACLLIITGLVILVDHAVSPSLPGQPVSGSITESKVQLIEQQLSAADELNNNGQAVQALQLYDKVLSEDPTDPNALAASGWLEWNYGSAAKIDAIEKVGRQQEKKAIRLAPDYYAGHLFLGLIILNSGPQSDRRHCRIHQVPGGQSTPGATGECGLARRRGVYPGEGAAPVGAGESAGYGRGIGLDHDDHDKVVNSVAPAGRRPPD